MTHDLDIDPRAQSLALLREWYPRGSTVYTVLRHVSPSGMLRVIGLVSLRANPDGTVDVRHPNYAASRVLDMRLDRNREGLRVAGAGMDMGFHVTYNLSAALYDGDGYALSHRWL